MQNKLEVLSKLANEFNLKDIHYGIGASALLYFYGLVDDFHDLDIVAEVEDSDKIEEIFKQFNCKNNAILKPYEFATISFQEYILDSVEIDIICGFKIIKDGMVYDCSFKSQDIEKYIEVNGIKIALDKLENWQRYYSLMGRVKKAEMIKNYLNKTSL